MARCSTSVELSDYKKAEVRADILNKKALRYDDCVASGCPAAVLHAVVAAVTLESRTSTEYISNCLTRVA